MPTTPFIVEKFAGLNLRDHPLVVGARGCTNCLNIALSGDRTIHPRPGLELHVVFSTLSQSVTPRFLYGLPSENRLLAVNGSGDVEVFDNAGASVDTDTTGTATSTNTYSAVDADDGTYVSNGTSPRFIDSSGNITAPAFSGHTPTGAYMAMTCESDRLVVNDGADRIRFSKPGDPLTFGADDWLDLAPDDTESIRAILTWDRYTFIFKQTKLWVYTGETIDSTGEPVFNVRELASIPGLDYTGYSATVGRNGIYYLSRTGVYHTAGEIPRKVTDVLDPLFAAIPDSFTEHGILTSWTVDNMPALHWAEDRLYVAHSSGGDGNDQVLVWDTHLGDEGWTLWSFDPGIMAICSHPIGSTNSTDAQLLVATRWVDQIAGSDHRAAIKSLTDTTDYEDESDHGSGTVDEAVVWSYESGLYDVSRNNQTVITRESALWGIGSATLRVATTGAANSSAGAYDTGSAVTLGTYPTIAVGWQGIDREGVLFKHRLFGSGGAQIDRLVHYIAHVKAPGIV